MKILKSLFITVVALISITTFAGSFGGSRASSSSSVSRSSSSFGGSRSYSAPASRSFGGSRSSVAPAPIIRTAPRVAPVAPTVNHTTIIHQPSGGGSGFFNGMMWGSMMNRPAVVVAGAPMVDGGGVSTVVVSDGHPIAWAIGLLIGSILVIAFVGMLMKMEDEA